MKISYIQNARIPTERAHGIQVMKMCQALAGLGHDVELTVPRRFNLLKENPFDYYGIAQTFKIRKLFCWDLIPFDKHLGHLGLWVETITFLFFVLLAMPFKKADLVYTRDKFFLPLSFFKKNFIFEAHTFPKNYFLYSPFKILRITSSRRFNSCIKLFSLRRLCKIIKGIIAPQGSASCLTQLFTSGMPIFVLSNLSMFRHRVQS